MLTNRMNLPQPFVDAARSRRKVMPNTYSCTQLLKGTCEIVLSRRHHDEIDEDVSDRVWAIIGTAVHKVLEEAQEGPEQLKEGFLTVALGKYTVTGIFDLYDDSTGTVTDYKTAGTIKWLKGEFDDYRDQCLTYCWMLRKNGFNAKRAEIVMILRDWVKSKAKFDQGYPQTQVQKVCFEFTDGDIAERELEIIRKLVQIEHADMLPDDRLEPCSEHERWHRDDTWAVVRKGNKKAFRVLGSESAATELAEKMSESGKEYVVEFRPGTDAKCEGYCAVTRWCPYYRKNF